MRKLTPKQEAFALAYVETSNASEAYRGVYNVSESTKPERIWSDASKVLNNPRVAQRVKELQDEIKERSMVTIQSITEELEEARKIATIKEQPANMVAASMGKAKVNGLLVERNDHTSSDKSMSPAPAIDMKQLSSAALQEIANLENDTNAD